VKKKGHGFNIDIISKYSFRSDETLIRYCRKF